MSFNEYLPTVDTGVVTNSQSYQEACHRTDLITRQSFLKALPDKGLLNFSIRQKHPFWDAIYTGLTYKQFYLSNKFKQILEKFKLSPHKFYNTNITKNKGESSTYNLLHMLYTVENPMEIDYEKSTFCIAPYHSHIPCAVYGYFSFPSYDIAEKLSNIRLDAHPISHHIIPPTEENISLYPYWVKNETKLLDKNISLGACYLMPSIKQYDLFVIPFLQDYVISSHLYQTLIENNITGISFKEAPFLKINDVE
jgi:hypothetical protein